MVAILKGGARKRSAVFGISLRLLPETERSALCPDVVPVAGIEPARHCWQWILSPPRLPVPTHRHSELIIYQARRFFKPGYKGRNILLDILPPQCYYNRANARVVELADSLDSGSSVHYARAGSSPASRTISPGSFGFRGFFVFWRRFLDGGRITENGGGRAPSSLFFSAFGLAYDKCGTGNGRKGCLPFGGGHCTLESGLLCLRSARAWRGK